ncbi:biotin/lipoyl-binding protein [Streptacidiphilus sp. PB12-B1b]|uniref:HlyD family efflux transporter periplasmic adaptor subunit n=1 Tax=Streptacidiphilus sp. PB12-B1b TaxID=2705012 RepID=UPI0015FCBF5A|nr:HlyD family efflux transporter periplasmic adaptor subunit [Streptacidiphilus sp. PB12-B1b]QMU76610.1 biotin/lipoyl-binding protein [Streptacidiphilus sp. PB12-B1b]
MTSKVPVRVRGMNAAAAVNDDPAGRAPEPRRRLPHASLRQLLVAVALLAVGVVLARYTFTEVTGGPTGFAGTVEAQSSVSLDFPQTGRVTRILVSTGQTVRQGQPLATLDQGYAQASLQDAEAVLAADQTVVKSLESPSLSAAGKQNLDLQVAAADQQLSSAQQASQDAVAQGSSQIGQAQQTVDNAQAALRADTAQYKSVCTARAEAPRAVPGTAPEAAPGHDQGFGPVGGAGPDPVGGGSGRSSLQPTPLLPTPQSSPQATPSGSPEQYCLTLQSQLQKDSAGVDSATAALANARADAAQLQDTAAHAASSAGAALALTRNQEAVATAPASAAQLSTAQANEAAAQTTVDQDRQNLAALTLVSPIAGVVADVGGIVGDLDGTGGVHGFSGPSGAQATSGPAFSLFPPAAGTGATSSGSSGQQPLIWLVSAQKYVLAQVSESEVASLHDGSRARITVNALGRTVDATVSQISPIPVDQNGSVQYPVRLAVPSWPQGTMTGMSTNVVFP